MRNALLDTGNAGALARTDGAPVPLSKNKFSRCALKAGEDARVPSANLPLSGKGERSREGRLGAVARPLGGALSPYFR